MMTLTDLVDLLRDEAPKRSAKRRPELEGIPGPALLKLAAAIEGYASPGGEPPTELATPATDAQLDLAAAMQPITGADALAELESESATMAALDLQRWGLRRPAPVPPEPDEPDVELGFAPPPPVDHSAPVDDGLRAPAAVACDHPPAALSVLAGGGHYCTACATLLTPPVLPTAVEVAGPKVEAELVSAPAPVEGELTYRDLRSWTQLETFTDCGIKYRARYVDRLPRRPAWWSVAGGVFHEIARSFETDRAIIERELGGDEAIAVLAEQGWTADGAAARFGPAFDEAIERLVAETDVPQTDWLTANQGREGRQWWYDNGGEQVAGYVKAALASDERPVAIDGSPLLEAKITRELGGPLVVGYLDHVAVNHAQRRIKIKDYKTGSRIPSDPGQLDTYAGLLASLRDEIGLPGYEVWGEYWQARKAVSAGARRLDTPERAAAIEQRFADFDRVERTGVYLARPSDFCVSCEVRDACPIMSSIPRKAKADPAKNLRVT